LSNPIASNIATKAVNIIERIKQSRTIFSPDSPLLPNIDEIINIAINEKMNAQNKEIIYFMITPPYTLTL